MSCVGYSALLLDKSILREVSAGQGAQREVHHDMSALW
jgi:hypothetical protein